MVILFAGKLTADATQALRGDPKIKRYLPVRNPFSHLRV